MRRSRKIKNLHGNIIPIGDLACVPVSAGGSMRYALIDSNRIGEVSSHNWYLTNNGYAATNILTDNGRKQILMHIFLYGKRDGRVTDHINRLRLDNRKENIRFVGAKENALNRGSHRGSAVGLSGVSMVSGICANRHTKRFRAQVCGKHIGSFYSKEDAFMAAQKYKEYLMIGLESK